MSQRRGSKRRKGMESADVHDQPQVEKEAVSKRAKLDNNAAGRQKETFSGLGKIDKGNVELNVVRRSGRTPKAKVRDYEDITSVSNSPDVSKDVNFSSYLTSNSKAKQSLTEPTHPRSDFDSSISDEPSVGNDKTTSENTKDRRRAGFDVGHKRETRKSYQKYLEELSSENHLASAIKTKSEIDSTQSGLKTTDKEIIQPNIKTSKLSTKSNNKTSLEQRSESKFVATTPVQNKTERFSNPQSEGELESLSPKIRTSKRTPVPKRRFSLLEDSAEDSKKTKKKESVLDEVESIHSEEQPKNEDLANPCDTQSVEDKHKIRPTVETTVKNVVSFPSNITSGKVKTPKQNARDKRQIPTPKSKQSGGKVKHIKSSQSLLLSESHSCHISSVNTATATATAMANTPDTPKSHILYPDSEHEEIQKRSEKKRSKKLAEVAIGSRSTGLVTSADINSPSLQSGTLNKRETTYMNSAELVPISEIVSALTSKPKTPHKMTVKQKPSEKSVEKKRKVKEMSQQEVSDDSSPSGCVNKVLVSPPSSSVLSSEVEQSQICSVASEGSDLNKRKLKKNHSKDTQMSSELELSQKHHHHHHHHHKHHKHSKAKKVAETATAEVREEEGEHIILKFHLPRDESLAKSKISTGSESLKESKKHSHSKVKKTHGSEAPSRSKEGSSSDGGTNENKMKLSIKFKGLYKTHYGLDVPTGNMQSSETEVSALYHKQKKGDQKKKKTADSSEKQRKINKNDQEKKPVKLIIKKNKTLLANEKNSPNKTSQSVTKTKTTVEKPVRETAVVKNATGGQKKKGKEEDSTKTPPSPKKALSAYLLFCKKQRHKVLEEFPGIEFSQISKKVGEAWNNLPEDEKQYWKDKAAELKRQIEASDMTTPKKGEIKQQGKPGKPNKSHAKSSHSKTENSISSTPTTQPIDMAAHLKLLGESLMTVGLLLKQQDQMEVHGSLSVLLDSALCAISPLLFLTSEIPEAAGVSKETQVQILDNLAYIMPGL